MPFRMEFFMASLLALFFHSITFAATAGRSSSKDLVVASDGRVQAVVLVAPDAGVNEALAAKDLVKYVGMMCGQAPTLIDTETEIKSAMAGKGPKLILGELALRSKPTLRVSLEGVLKKKPHLRTDGIVLLRDGDKVYIAGNNDLAHYFAVAELLRRWGCRWYIPTDFGECVPDERDLKIGDLDFAFSSPFEIRSYWISWVGDNSGRKEFQMRNMMSGRGDLPPTGHALGKYTKGLGKGTFNFPITDPKTAEYVAGKVESMYASSKSFSLGMEDGSYDSAYPGDQKLMKLQWDKYFLRWSVTDPMLELYNNVASVLQKKHPESKAKIGFLAYANMTIPPVRDMVAERSLFAELAPIDIDPIHGMDDHQSPPRQEYRDMMYKWAKVMQGRLCIYDYDQGMLVWRDIPNPSHQSFAQDVQHYRKAGILGVNTESRNAIATTFINLYLRSRLLWNPDEDVDVLLDDFYSKFFGPAEKPMRAYWSTIFKAWEETICTEHEYFVAPSIYTAKVLAVLKTNLLEAEQIINGLKVQGRVLTRNEKLYLERIRFMRYSYDVTAGYLSMVRAAATECDYAGAVAAGKKALAVREKLTDMNGIFTTYRNYKVEHRGYAWWPGEVRQYEELLPFTNGEKGKLVAKLPLEWDFHRDADHKGIARGFASKPVDLTFWKANHTTLTPAQRKDYPNEWERLRVDLYAQAQGILHPDYQSYVGDLWYRTDLDLKPEQTVGKVHLRFPGLFNECRLYLNGKEVAVRKQGKLWWRNDYRFEWDVELTGKLKSGKNVLALVCKCEHHFGGMFRRPFLYRAVAK